MATAADNGTTVKEGKSSSPVEKTKSSSSGGQASSKVEELDMMCSIKRALSDVSNDNSSD